MSSSKEFFDLLSANPSESRIQRFLERNPHLFLDLFLSPSSRVVRQLPIGDGEFRSDFAFAHSDSGGNHLTFLELESPQRKIFNKDDSFSQAFNHAVQQVRDWVAWTRSHPEWALRMMGRLIGFLKSENVYVGGLLVMGRRAELSSPRRRARFEALVNEWQGCSVRTYDGFAERLEHSESWLLVRTRHVPLFAHQAGSFREINAQSDPRKR